MIKNEKMSLEKAVELGEYDPDSLSSINEWKTLSPHAQLQYIRKGLDNKRRQLLEQWAEMDRVIDLRLKPEMETAKNNVEKKLRKIEDDRERLYFEYSKKF